MNTPEKKEEKLYSKLVRYTKTNDRIAVEIVTTKCGYGNDDTRAALFLLRDAMTHGSKKAM